MHTVRRFATMAILFGGVMLAAAVTSAAEVLVFAAASLTDALRETRVAYERQSGDRIAFNFDASGTLARQIMEGAPADLYFSADQSRMNALAAKGLIRNDTRIALLGNTLVMVAASDSRLAAGTPDVLLSNAVTRIAMGDPLTVPAGTYTKEYLERKGLWKKIADRVVPTANVRAALAAVEAGNAEVGFVFKTDAHISHNVKVILDVPPQETPPIVYPAAIVRDAPHAEAASRFLDFLKSPAATAIFRKFGFSPATPP